LRKLQTAWEKLIASSRRETTTEAPMTTTSTRRAVARAAVIAAATSLAALTLASPASADETLIGQKYVGIDDCSRFNQGSGQICPTGTPNYNLIQYAFEANQPSIKVEFTANANHCADMIAHLYFDGTEWGSNIVHPGQTDGGYEIPIDRSGHHFVAVRAEGVLGGCNTGTVSAWGGTIRVWQLT
jgi:hypothetical protein